MKEHLPLSVTAAEAASLLGVSERSFHEFRKRKGFPPAVLLFGPLRPRWRVSDLWQYVESLPTLDPQPMPMQLIEGKRRKRVARNAADRGEA